MIKKVVFTGWIFLIAITASISLWCREPETRMVTDMGGRTVAVPRSVKKVFSTSQIGTITIYTINPGKLAGWNFALMPEDRKYITAKYHNLPVLGAWSGKNNTANIEEIIKIHPDLIVSMGTIDKTYISSADRIQKQLGIPVVLVEGALTGMERSYQFIGNMIGEKTRAKILGDYCRRTIETVGGLISAIPPEKRLTVYYAEGPRGLETDPAGSFHTEVLDFVKGVNVAEVPALSGYGRSRVSMEQVLAWDPEIILVGNDKEAVDSGFYGTIFFDTGWAGIRAVKNKRVYRIPANPFDWFDRPPGVNRMIGVKWLAGLFYPDRVTWDIKSEVKDFYALFYNCRLSDQEVRELTKYSI